MLQLLTKPRPSAGDQRAWSGSRKLGWIGVDVGSRAVKCAQVDVERGEWRLTQAHIEPWSSQEPLDHAAVGCGSVGELLAHTAIGQTRTAKPAACTLSMSLTELRSLELPGGTDDELRQLISQELADGMGESPCEFAFWRSPRTDADAELMGVTVLAIRTDTALAVAENLLRRNCHCRVLTPLPYALARAVTLADAEARHTTVAALDWGCSTPSITIVRHGRPVFTRTLRECGVWHIVKALSQRMELEPHECWQLMESWGVHSRRDEAAGALAQRITELTGPITRQLAQQLERTRSFLRQHYRELTPQRVWLFGAGAMLAPSFPAIATAMGAEVQPWRLSTNLSQADDDVDPTQAILGAAIGLSALGVEP